MSNNRCSRRVIVVLRPTVSGLDESAARRMFDAVQAGTDADVRVAYLDVSSPSLHEELDRAHVDDVDKVVLIPVAVPRIGTCSRGQARRLRTGAKPESTPNWK